MIIMVPKIIVLAVLASFIAVSCGQVTVSEDPQPSPPTTPPTTTTTTAATTTANATTPASTTTPGPEPKPTTSTTPKPTTPSTTTKPTTTSPTTTSTSPATTSTSAPTTTPKPSPKPPQKPDVGNWNVTYGNITCIMVDMAVQLNVSYTAKDNTTNYAIIDIPKNTTADGTCVGKTQLFNLTWFQNATKSELYLTFTRNDEKEDRFMIGMINLTVIPDDVVFPNIRSNDSIILFSNKTEFSTPVSKSYRCEKEQVFELEKVGTNITAAKMTVSHVHLEAFHTKKNAEFDAVEDCEPSNRPDIVPIAVGCALVGLVAIVLIAYLVGRRRSQARGYLSIEQQAKFIQERITSVEKHFAELCTIFAAYTRKNAGLRDKSDEVAKVIQEYAEAENVNKSLKKGLLQFSTTLSAIGDYRDAQVQRLETKVVAELSQYEDICKHSKEEVKNTFVARDRELARKKNLDRIRERNPRNRQQISLAEAELLKASADVSRTIKALEEQTDMFEKKKLQDIKALLLSFITIELSFHSKAIEFFTKAYQDVADIDENEDLEEFRNVLRVPDAISRLDTVKRTSFRNSSFSLASLFATPPGFKRQSQGIPHSPTTATSATDTVESLKTGLEDSIESVHVEDYVEDESSSLVSEEEDRKHIKISKVCDHYIRTVEAYNSADKKLQSQPCYHSCVYIT